MKRFLSVEIGYDEDNEEIVGQVSTEGDGPFIMECLALVVREYAAKTGVPPLEVVQDLYSVVAQQETQAAEAGG